MKSKKDLAFEKFRFSDPWLERRGRPDCRKHQRGHLCCFRGQIYRPEDVRAAARYIYPSGDG